MSRTKSSRGLSGKSKSSRILSKVALKKDDKDHTSHKGTTSHRRGSSLLGRLSECSRLTFHSIRAQKNGRARSACPSISAMMTSSPSYKTCAHIHTHTHARTHAHTHTHTHHCVR